MLDVKQIVTERLYIREIPWVAGMGTSQESRYLGHWIKAIDHEFTVRGNRLLKPFGLTRTSWYVIHYVSTAGTVTQKALQEALGVESGSVAIIVDGLVRKGWLDRAPSETDRRVNHLKLTPEGSARWRSVPDAVSILRRRMMRGVTKEEETAAVEVLKKCWENLTAPSRAEEQS